MGKLLTIFFTIATLLPAMALELQLHPSLAVNVRDQVDYTEPSRAVVIPHVAQVVPGQPFRIYFELRDTKNLQAVKLDAALTRTAPDGKSVMVEKFTLTPAAGERKSFIPENFSEITFSTDDIRGKHRFTLTISGNGTTAAAEASVELRSEMPDYGEMSSKKEFDTLFTNYASNPDPTRLNAAVRYFFNRFEPDMRARSHNHFLHILYALAVAYRQNPQLWDDLARLSTELSAERHQIMMALLFTAIGEKAVVSQKELIDPQVQAHIAMIPEKRHPLLFKNIGSAPHILMAITEYLITGTIAPVRKLTDALRQLPDTQLTAIKEKVRKKQPLTAPEKAVFSKHILQQMVTATLASGVANDPLLKNYLETIVRRNLVPDSSAAARITGIIIWAETKKTTQGSRK